MSSTLHHRTDISQLLYLNNQFIFSCYPYLEGFSPPLDSFDLEGQNESGRGQERFTGFDVEVVVQQRHLQDVARERQHRHRQFADLNILKNLKLTLYVYFLLNARLLVNF